MKKLILLVGALAATTTFAKDLKDYKQIRASVTTGKLVRIATDLTKCTATKAKVFDDSINFGVYTPNEIIINNNEDIVASLNHFTHRDHNFPNKAVIQSIQYVISPNNNVTLNVQIIDALVYQPLTDPMAYNCQLNTAAKVYEL